MMVNERRPRRTRRRSQRLRDAFIVDDAGLPLASQPAQEEEQTKKRWKLRISTGESYRLRHL